jgi:hypothetical protein
LSVVGFTLFVEGGRLVATVMADLWNSVPSGSALGSTTRSVAEVHVALGSLEALHRRQDQRLHLLAEGGLRASARLRFRCSECRDLPGNPDSGGLTVKSKPATGPGRHLRETCPSVGCEGTGSDAARIVVRGAEEWLAWSVVPGYPTPLWLVPGMVPEEIHAWVLGRVGEGTPGLFGPGPSPERFPYDLADVIDQLGPR